MVYLFISGRGVLSCVPLMSRLCDLFGDSWLFGEFLYCTIRKCGELMCRESCKLHIDLRFPTAVNDRGFEPMSADSKTPHCRAN